MPANHNIQGTYGYAANQGQQQQQQTGIVQQANGSQAPPSDVDTTHAEKYHTSPRTNTSPRTYMVLGPGGRYYHQ